MLKPLCNLKKNKMKYCSKNHSNPDDAVFCAECGEKLVEHRADNEMVCSKCGTKNPKDALFCNECGADLNKEETTSTQSTQSTTSSSSSNSSTGNYSSQSTFFLNLRARYRIAEFDLGKAFVWSLLATVVSSVYSIVFTFYYLVEYGDYVCLVMLLFSVLAILSFNGVLNYSKDWLTVWRIILPLEAIGLFGSGYDVVNIYGGEYTSLHWLFLILLIIGYVVVLNILKGKNYYFH